MSVAEQEACFTRLVMAVVEGTATPADRAAFQALLREHPEFLLQYIEQMRIHGLMCYRTGGEVGRQAEAGGREKAAAEATEAGMDAGGRKRVWWKVAAAAAALAVVGVTVWQATTARRSEDLGVRGGVAASGGVVIEVLAAKGAKVNRMRPVAGDDRLVSETREIRLAAGTLRFRLDSGAVLTLFGPARLGLTDGMHVTLQRGRLLADIGPEAVGFTVEAPNARVWDLGTLFGVEVRGSGTTDVYVFEGQVMVERPSGAFIENCVAGEGVRVRDGHDPVKVRASLLANKRLVREMSPQQVRTEQEDAMKTMKTIMSMSAAAVIAASSTFAEDGVWVNPSGGAWESPSNWQEDTVASGEGATATFGTLVPGGDVAVSVGSALTLGNLVFGGFDNAYQWLLSGGTLTLAGETLPVIEANNREVVVANNFITAQGFEKRGAGTLVLTGTNFSESVLSVSVGTLALSNNASLTRTRLALADGAALRVDGVSDFWSLENLGAGAPQVTVNGTAKVGRWTDRDGATEYGFAGAVSGGGALVKQGGNRQVLEGAVDVAAVEVAGGMLAVVPKDDIVAWFGFDDSADIGRDAGPSGVTLTKEGDNGSWHEPQGRFGGALRLNGASCLIHDKTEAVPLRLPTGDAAFTLAAWIRRDADVPTRGGIASWGHMYGGYNSAALRMDSASTVIQASAGHTAVALDAPGEWQHVALTYDPSLASGRRKIYVNGVAKRSDNPSAAFTLNTAFVSVGRTSPNSSSDQNQFFKGLLDEVLFARAALSPEQLQALMTGGAAAFYAPPAVTNLLPTAAALSVGPSGRLVVGADQTVARIDGAGGVVALAGGATLTIATTQDVTLASSVAGLGGLVKRGAGTTLTVAARQGYAGPTRVEEGTLEVLNLAPRVMDGIVGYWTFDNWNNPYEDISGNNIQLQPAGGTPTYFGSYGRVGGCVLLNNKYLVPAGGFPEMMPTGNAPCSISIWVNPTGNIGSQGGFIYWGDESGATRSSLNLRLNSSYTSLTLASNDGGVTAPNIGFDIRTGEPSEGLGIGWHHLCYTYDPAHPTQKLRLYVNGVLQATANQGDYRVRNSGFRIGCGRSTTSNMGDSYIDDTIIFNRAITAEEVLYLSKGNIVAPSAAEAVAPVSGVVGYYPFNDPAQLGRDMSGYGNHLGVTGAGATHTAGGKFGGALNVADADSWVGTDARYPVGFPTGRTPYTFACWFNPADNASIKAGLFYAGSEASLYNLSGRLALDYMSMSVETTGATTLSGSAGYNLYLADLPSGWHHFATTCEPMAADGKRKLYVDGRLVARDNITTGTLGTNFFHIGRGRLTSASENAFTGRIDEFVVMNRAATLAEIAYLAAGMPEELSGVLPGRTALEIAAGARAVFKGGTPNRVGGVSGAGELALDGMTALAVGGGRTNVFSGTLTGASSVSVSGGSAQTLPLGAFIGALAVSNATLLITADGGTAASGVAVASGGRFGGAGATATPVAVASGGALVSRTGQAALTLGGGVTLAAGAGFRLEASGGQTEGNLQVSGALALPASGFVELEVDGARQGTYVVAEAAGGITVDGSLNDWEVSAPDEGPAVQRRLKVEDNKLVLRFFKKGLMVLVH
jgi:autotransporter-associated beta strand protein